MTPPRVEIVTFGVLFGLERLAIRVSLTGQNQTQTMTQSPSASFPFARLLCLVIAAGSVDLASAEVTLRGNVGKRVIDDDVVIAQNTKAVLNGTVIKGNVRVLAGAKLVAKRARIDGDVQSFKALKVELRRGTRVDGDFQGEGTRTMILKENSKVEGNVQTKESSAAERVTALQVLNATVDGDVQAEKGSGRYAIIGSTVDGNIQVVENQTGLYQIRRNRVAGDLQYFKNRGAGTITGNWVDGNLQSKENSPAPKVSGNRVEGDTELE